MGGVHLRSAAGTLDGKWVDSGGESGQVVVRLSIGFAGPEGEGLGGMMSPGQDGQRRQPQPIARTKAGVNELGEILTGGVVGDAEEALVVRADEEGG